MVESFQKVFDAVTGVANPRRSADDVKESIELFIEAARERRKGDDCIYDTEDFREMEERYYAAHPENDHRSNQERHNINSESQAAYGSQEMSPEQYANDRK